MEFQFNIERNKNKSYKKPPSQTYISQIDYNLDFYPSISSGQTIFNVPRITDNKYEVDRSSGFNIDLGLNWAESKLSLRNSIVPRTFLDSYYGFIDENGGPYYSHSDRDFYVKNYKGERWKISTSNGIDFTYLTFINNLDSKNVFGNKIIENDSILKSNYFYDSSIIYRVFHENNNIYIANSLDWSSSTFICQGEDPCIIKSNGIFYLTYTKNNLIYLRKNTSNYWGDEILINEAYLDFVINPSPFDPAAIYSSSYMINYANTVWIFYVKTIGENSELKYVLESQNFKIEQTIPSIFGVKSNINVFLAEDDRLYLSFINKYDEIYNIYFIYSPPIRSGFLPSNANAYNSQNPISEMRPPKDECFLELIRI